MGPAARSALRGQRPDAAPNILEILSQRSGMPPAEDRPPRGPRLSQRVHSEPELSVVIAVGDHEDSIGHLIRNVASHLTSLGRSFEILIVNSGCGDNSLSIASLLAGTMPELEVLARDAAGRAFLRGTSEARGSVVVLLDASRPLSLAPLGWALGRLAAGRDAVVLRGRYVVARRLAVLPVIVRAA